MQFQKAGKESSSTKNFACFFKFHTILFGIGFSWFQKKIEIKFLQILQKPIKTASKVRENVIVLFIVLDTVVFVSNMEKNLKERLTTQSKKNSRSLSKLPKCVILCL